MTRNADETRRPDWPARRRNGPGNNATRDYGSRMRVYTFIPRLRCGGTENQMMALTKRLDPDRYDLRFGFLDSVAFAEAEEAVNRWPMQAYPVQTFMGTGVMHQMWRLVRDLRRIRPHVLHSYNFYANAFSIPAARLAGVPAVIASVRDMGVYSTPMQQRVHRAVCRLADRVVVNAEAIKGWLVDDGFRAEKIRVIRNGVEVPDRPDVQSGTTLRGELGIPSAARVVLMTARLNPKKGIEDLLAAAVRVIAEVPDAWFVVVGDVVLQTPEHEKAYSARLKTMARDLGVAERVLFTGYRRDVSNLLQMADVSVLPSWSEGLPNAVLEAMASGVPVVATRVGGIPELIEDGITGLLVDPHDVAGLGAALVAALSDRDMARRLGGTARMRAREGFSFDRVIGETEALYREVLADDSVGRRRSISSLVLS